jgi:hypothetical protein
MRPVGIGYFGKVTQSGIIENDSSEAEKLVSPFPDVLTDISGGKVMRTCSQ